MTRASPDDWLDAGLVLLRDGGAGALTIDTLCRALDRTKGSFYHHFTDIDGYQERLLAHWEARSTAAPIAAANQAPAGAARRRRLHDAVARLELHVERAMQVWALRDPRARRARARVDALRVAYLARIWQEEGATAARARELATLEYASFLGSLQLFDLADAADARAAARLSAKLLGYLRSAIATSARPRSGPGGSVNAKDLRRAGAGSGSAKASLLW